MSHSKRNTSLAYFTSHERSLLRSNWGSQSTRLTRESFLPFGFCRLCLGYAREPVCCAGDEGGDGGATKVRVHLFCRECVLNDLMAQRKEIKRLEREAEARQQDELGERARGEEERKRMDLEAFERNELGFEDGAAASDAAGRKRKREAEEIHSRRAENGGDGSSKKPKSSESSFWIPSSSTNTSSSTPSTKPKSQKLHPLCPASTQTTQHNYALKSLIPVSFTEPSSNFAGEEPSRTCPSCKKALTNTSRPMLGTAEGCGHVICGSCADLFLKGSDSKSGPAKQNGEVEMAERIRCFVCEADLCGRVADNDGTVEMEKSGKKDKHKNSKEKTSRAGRLVEISCEGTGFAGGGANMAKREGVAFQC